MFLMLSACFMPPISVKRIGILLHIKRLAKFVQTARALDLVIMECCFECRYLCLKYLLGPEADRVLQVDRPDVP